MCLPSALGACIQARRTLGIGFAASSSYLAFQDLIAEFRSQFLDLLRPCEAEAAERLPAARRAFLHIAAGMMELASGHIAIAAAFIRIFPIGSEWDAREDLI